MALLGMALLETAGHFWHKGTFSSQSGVSRCASHRTPYLSGPCGDNAWSAVAE